MPYSDELLLDDPHTSGSDLQRIAADRPDLRAKVASHPNAYPALLEWLGELGDPRVDAALEARDRPRPTIGLPVDVVMPTTGQSAATAPSQASAPYAASYPSANAAAYGPAHVGTVRKESGLSAPIVAIILLLLAVIVALIVLWLKAQADDTGAAAPVVTETTTSETGAPADPSETDSSEPATTKPAPTDPASTDPGQAEVGPYVPEGEALAKVSAPSGNIACEARGDGSFECTILQRNFSSDQCPVGPVSVSVSADGAISIECGELVSQGGLALDYGQTVALGTSGGCTSTEEGMRCWSGANNQGVNIARAGITEITGP